MIKYKSLFVIFCLIIFNCYLFADRTITSDRHLKKLVSAYNVLSIDYVEDIGEVLFDPVIKITLLDGKSFYISHAFSKNHQKLMLYKIDDYECSYTLTKGKSVYTRPYGIGFNYLEKFFDFKIKSITDIIEHYDKIHEFISLLNTYFSYSLIDNGTGGKCRDFLPDSIYNYPGYLELKDAQLILYIWDRNEDRVNYIEKKK